MDISSRDSVVIVATFCCVYNFVIFLVHIFPPEATLSNKEPGHMAYIRGVRTFESAFSVFVDIITIIGVWDMDKHTTPSRKHKHGSRHKSLISRLKKPRRALLLFIIWSITTSPASVGPDMVYNYNTSGSTERFVLNTVIRLSIEAAKFYVLYRFGRLYWQLGVEQRPIIIEGATEGASSVGSARLGADASDVKLGSAHFRRRIPYGADHRTSSIIAGSPADTTADQPHHGQHQAVGGAPTFLDWEGPPLNDPHRLECAPSRHRRAGRSTSGEASLVVPDNELDATYESHVIRADGSPQKTQSERGWQSRRSTEEAASGTGTFGGRPLPERKSGRRLSILAPTDVQRPGTQPAQERVAQSSNDSPVLSGSVRSILRNPDVSPRRQRQPGERETSSVDATAALEASPSDTVGQAEVPDDNSALRRPRPSGEASSPPLPANVASPSLTSPDRVALDSNVASPQGELSTTTTGTMSTRRERKSKRSSRKSGKLSPKSPKKSSSKPTPSA